MLLFSLKKKIYNKIFIQILLGLQQILPATATTTICPPTTTICSTTAICPSTTAIRPTTTICPSTAICPPTDPTAVYPPTAILCPTAPTTEAAPRARIDRARSHSCILRLGSHASVPKADLDLRRRDRRGLAGTKRMVENVALGAR